jgi:phosphohistidine swiveling domain-containing protein
MVRITMPEQRRRRLRDGVLDYFPNRLTVMDRDTSLSLVDATLDYLRDAGLADLAAEDVLRLTPDGLGVEVDVPSVAQFPLRTAYRAVRTLAETLRGLPADPDDWVRSTLPRYLAEAESLRARVPNADGCELLDLIHQGCRVRDEVFTSRRRHFLSSFAVKILASLRARSTSAGDRPRGRLAPSAPSRRFDRALAELADLWYSEATGLPEFADRWATVLDAFGGRGESFLPMVSDRAWDVYDVGLRSALESGPPEGQPVNTGASSASSRTGWVARRLDSLATERDWVVHGYEQATRAPRLALLRLGGRLADHGALPGPRDVFHLTLSELEQVVTDRIDAAQLLPVVAARREWFERAATVAVPAETTSSGPDADEVITGFAASPGRYVGTAHVVTSLEQAVQLEPGAILVCRMTSPSWVPTMARAGAIVTDRGGFLSHAAIVARELDKPTVTGTHDATGRMRTGGRYEVNGTLGMVRPEVPD